MKLTIGENIRKFRRKNDLTQEALAALLGVSYQSVSRWENGTTYPDLELIPAISALLSVTVDELLGMPQIEKEKRAAATFDALRRECIKEDYDAKRIVSLLRDIRRNYLESASAQRPFTEGNDRAFRDPEILPEVRLLAEAYLERRPMDPHVIETMAEVEDEEHLEEFLQKYTTAFDCSARALLFKRYFRRGDAERFEPERRYQLYEAFNTLLASSRYLLEWGHDREAEAAADRFMEDALALIRGDAEDERPDLWIADRLELGFKAAERALSLGDLQGACEQIAKAVILIEATMAITAEVALPTSCRFLDGMEWRAKEDWMSSDNNPDSPEERMIYMSTRMSGMVSCHCLFPSNYYNILNGNDFEPLRNLPEFTELCERVKVLIVTKQKES
jgi:transcriptional regulator with XRE-family HTH domain